MARTKRFYYARDTVAFGTMFAYPCLARSLQGFWRVRCSKNKACQGVLGVLALQCLQGVGVYKVCNMAKGNKGTTTLTGAQAQTLGIPAGQVVAAAVAQPAAVVLYGLGKLPRNGLNDGTKHGQGGTAGTYAAVCAALQAAQGGLAMPALQAVCKANGDPGFARYAVRNHWLLPVTAK